MDKLYCLQLFIRIAQLGTFTAAANEFNTTQSAVSKKIAWLEQQVGLTLFHRHARSIALTDSGQQYLALATKLTEELRVGESQLRQEQTSVSGRLKLSVPSSFSVQLLAAPLNEFLQLHPSVSVDVSVSDKLVDLLDDDIDIAIRATYLKDSGLKAKWLMDNQLVYVASPEYLAQHSVIESASDLSQHRCLTYTLSNPSNIWRFKQNDEELKVKVHEHIRSDNPAMLVEMAKLGQGIAAMPKWMIENELKSDQLTLILEQYPSFKLPMYLVYKESGHQPLRIRAFIDFLSGYFVNSRSHD